MLGLQACLEWRLLSLLLPSQTAGYVKAAACQTIRRCFMGNIPGKPWRPIVSTCFPLPSSLKPCNDLHITYSTVLKCLVSRTQKVQRLVADI